MNGPKDQDVDIDDPYKEFVFTSDSYDEVSEDSPMFSVDCEMCLTTSGRNELTRISVVNERMEQMYHSLVMPPNPIVNYLTRYSGITEEMLRGVTTTLADVQAELRRVLPPNAILVGQVSYLLTGELTTYIIYEDLGTMFLNSV